MNEAERIAAGLKDFNRKVSSILHNEELTVSGQATAIAMLVTMNFVVLETAARILSETLHAE